MKKNRQILVLAALLFSFLCFPADKVLAASNVVEVPLTVKQNFEEWKYYLCKMGYEPAFDRSWKCFSESQ